MGENEFSSNGSRASVVDGKKPGPRLDEVLSRIARLAQRQSRGPIPFEDFEREIGAIERILEGLPSHELTDAFGTFVRGELVVLRERNLRDATELRDDPRIRTLASMVRDYPRTENPRLIAHKARPTVVLRMA